MSQAWTTSSEDTASPHATATSCAPYTVAVVLAGGEGRRMGGSKPLRALGRSTLLANALRLARGYCADVAVAVRDPAQLAGATDADLLLDAPGIAGPLAGLASALRLAARQGAARVLTLPCDAPRLPPDLRQRLEAALSRDSPAQVAIASSADRLHPTCALWSVEALDALQAYAATGQRSLNGLAGELCMSIVAWDAGDADPFANANTPEDLAALQPGAHGFGY